MIFNAGKKPESYSASQLAINALLEQCDKEEVCSQFPRRSYLTTAEIRHILGKHLGSG